MKYILTLLTILSLNTFGQNFKFSINDNIYQITTAPIIHNGGEYEYYTLYNLNLNKKVDSRMVGYVNIIKVEPLDKCDDFYVDQQHTKIIKINDNYFAMFFQLKHTTNNYLSIIRILPNGRMNMEVYAFFTAKIPMTISREDGHYVINTTPKINLYINQCHHSMWYNCYMESICLTCRYTGTCYGDGILRDNECD